MVDVAIATPDSIFDVLCKGMSSLGESLVQALSSDTPLMINLGMLRPNFITVYTHRDVFPSDTIFDWAELQTKKVQTKLLQNTASRQDLNKTFYRSPDISSKDSTPCSITIRSSAGSQREV